MYKFQDLKIGQTLKKKFIFKRNLVLKFAETVDDKAPIHIDLDYANRWNAPLLKKKVTTKSMIIINTTLVCIIIYLVII